MPDARADLVVDSHEPRLGEVATATFSADRVYRYQLTRTWDPDRPATTFLMLNPSTADAFVEDPTIRRCLGFARRWGAGSLTVLNLFALRSTSPEPLKTHPEPVGAANDTVLRTHLATGAGPVVAAWGSHGVLHDRATTVRQLIADTGCARLVCLGVTKDGHPRHPLYIPGAAPLVAFGVRHA